MRWNEALFKSYFSEPQAAVLRLVERAAKVYKHCYGEYPEQIGLDIFTRFREYQKTDNHGRGYYFRELGPIIDDERVAITNVCVEIVPATFANAKTGVYGIGLVCTDPTRGRDEVWCKRGKHEIHMWLLLTEHGYHATIPEEGEKNHSGKQHAADPQGD